MLESDEENESDESSVPQADDSADLSEESDQPVVTLSKSEINALKRTFNKTFD